MDDQVSENKLILLYMIYEKENISESGLVDFVIFRMYMDFFTMQSCMDELEQQGLIVRIESGGQAYYTLMPEGDQVVQLFYSRIPHSIREDIRTYAKDSFLHDSPLMNVSSVCEQKDEHHYVVTCQVLDNDRPVLSFLVTADTPEGANRIRSDWTQKGMSIYMDLLKELGTK